MSVPFFMVGLENQAWAHGGIAVYKRVLIKLSGEALGIDGALFDFAQINKVAETVAGIARGGVEVALMIGGGNLWRGRRGPSANMDCVTADHMGMLATVINSLAMRDAVERCGVETRVMSAVPMPPFAEGYVPREAVRAMREGRIVLFAAGNGDPFHSTDTAAAQRAAEIGADALLMAKNVDGIYTANPQTDPSATLIPAMTYAQALAMRQGAIDDEALVIARNTKLPLVLIFGLKEPDDIRRAAVGGHAGTAIRP